MTRWLILLCFVALPAQAASVNPDGTTSAAPNGPALTTAAGVWTWTGAAPGRPGEYYVNLNAVTHVGIGTMMEVANNGQLYVQTAGGGWYLWNNGFTQSAAPPAPSVQPVATLLTKDISWVSGRSLASVPLGWFPQSATIRTMNCRIETPVGGTATFYLVKAPSGTPLAKGTRISPNVCNGNLSGAANQNLLPSGTVAVNPGDTIGLFTTDSAWATGMGMGIATIGYTVP